MSNPRGYLDEIRSVESGRPLRRGVKSVILKVDGHAFSCAQPGWWASLDDQNDNEAQLTDDDNVVRAAVRRQARAKFNKNPL
jgi:hypothetical protein